MNKHFPTAGATAVALAAALASSTAIADISIVGSSTVYPFATVVGERFGQITGLAAPNIESTGTGGGMKLLCAGGDAGPDISNASRRIKSSEVELCASSGVGNLVEVKIGFDGIVFAQSLSGAPISLTRAQLFKALARDVIEADGSTKPNPHQSWSDVAAGLPDVKIQVYGPPPTSGTRDAFVELVMEEGCEKMDGFDKLGKDEKGSVCKAIREDGLFIEAGENDNLIIQRLATNADAFGIFGYSFLEENADRVRGVDIEGVTPSFESIADSSYPVSRPLFFYVKSSALESKEEVAKFVEFFAAEESIGEDGFLSDRGLIPLPAASRDEVRAAVSGRQAVRL
ncbi:MAG: substrate-binding domain-containing protein [Betaproteobacteria bacterium]|nr:substrate-binding domain-containing protein [Betaproteobacteria bacterium]